MGKKILGPHVVHNADCLAVLQDLPADHFDLTITDPPFHTTDLSFDKAGKDQNYAAIYREIKRTLKPAGWFFCFATIEMAAEILGAGWRRKFEYVWVKPRLVMKTHNTIRPYYQHEIIIGCIKPELKKMADLYFDPTVLRTDGEPYKRKRGGLKATQFIAETRTVPIDENGFEKLYMCENVGFREGTTVIYDCNKNTSRHHDRTDHPTQKPASLYELIMRAYCPPGGRILDPFGGSGTALQAAAKTGRESTLMEINQKYYEEIIRRYQERPPNTNLEIY